MALVKLLLGITSTSLGLERRWGLEGVESPYSAAIQQSHWMETVLPRVAKTPR